MKKRDMKAAAQRGGPQDLFVLRRAREALQEDLDAVVHGAVARGAGATMMPSEGRRFEKLALEISELDELIKPIAKRFDAVAAAHVNPAGPGPVVVRSECPIYRPDQTDEVGRQLSLVRDLAHEALARVGSGFLTNEAIIRLEAFRKRQATYESGLADMERKAARGIGLAETENRSAFVAGARLEEMRQERAAVLQAEQRSGNLETRINPNTTLGTGGEFVPPLWLVDQYIPLARPRRVVADRCMLAQLPPGIDVINIPKITTGSDVEIQAAQGGAVASVDIKTTTVAAPVVTLAGQEDISIQLIEQSPIAMDGVVFQDLQADLEKKLDAQVLNGSGTGGQITGLLNTSGINNITFTNASPTWPLLYPTVLQAMSAIFDTRFDAPDTVITHPRRTTWMLGQLDANSNRPLAVPDGQAPYNELAQIVQLGDMDKAVGRMLTLPWYHDSNMPTTLGGPANQDPLIMARFSDVILWESTTRFRAMPEVLSGTLQIRMQVYRYIAFAVRFAPSISVILGTGQAAPAGYL